MGTKIMLWFIHITGLGFLTTTLLNINLNTWEGKIMMCISALYGLSFTVIYLAKGILDIQDRLWDRKMKRKDMLK